jgi:hypothetical protein
LRSTYRLVSFEPSVYVFLSVVRGQS